jgi:8-oxo-dGTP pyrophosphatase MutT (NUDIX family)
MRSTSAAVRQAAAIPVKGNQICLITSSDGKRWVIPKGHIEPGHTPQKAAVQEAWEEAGLVGILEESPIGDYVYEKAGVPYHVTVFVLHVSRSADAWPEAHRRERCWVRAEEAVNFIAQRGLNHLIQQALDQLVALS